MAAIQNRSNLGNQIFFGSIMALVFAPHDYKLPALGIFYFVLILAAVVDSKKNTKRVRRITRRVASCSCEKARETISHMRVPQLLRNGCTVCGAETT
ncbi:MAG TPA: hypothetical protein V6C97_17175 [Oculatellaceae cyanobacterium]